MKACLACGREAPDVAMRVVEVAPVDQRIVQAANPIAETERGVAGFEYSDVRERYIAEWRCRDTAECAARANALDEATAAAGHAPLDDGPSWLRPEVPA